MIEPTLVSFFLPGEASLASLRTLDPDTSPEEFQTAERAWTLQTYLRLRAAGLPVELTERVPRRGLVVFHAKHKREIQRQRRDGGTALWVALRGDRNPVQFADFEILQNGACADRPRAFDVPHWPQPGLLPRDPTRRDEVRVAAYKGFAGNLDPAFAGEPWRRRLAELDVAWVCDAEPFDRAGFRRYSVEWSNYRQVDVIVAVRSADRQLHVHKPASKLINAWLAGVPALLGPEVAFRQLRRSGLDYLEVTNLIEAEDAVRRLRDEPGLFRAMVENGQGRAREFVREPMIEAWRNLLFETIPAAAAASRPRCRSSLVTLTASSWLRRLSGRLVG